MTTPNPYQPVLDAIQSIAQGDEHPIRKLERILRVAAIHRSRLIANTVINDEGLRVLDGPFKGMEFTRTAQEGCLVPKLLGCYELELHPHILDAATTGYRTIIDIGCAEGYYAVGFARLIPEARVLAHDTNPNAQKVCKELAIANGVDDRVEVGGLFRGEDFARHAPRTPGERALVFCDIEGAEASLLDPRAYPDLALYDLIVETHPRLGLDMAGLLRSRFESSHDITLIEASGRDVALPNVLRDLSHMDQLLAVWEWRSNPTPWLVMKARRSATPDGASRA